MQNMQDTTRNMSKAGSGLRLTRPEIWSSGLWFWVAQPEASRSTYQLSQKKCSKNTQVPNSVARNQKILVWPNPNQKKNDPTQS